MHSEFILHTLTSLDGAVSGFEPNREEFEYAAHEMNADAWLISAKVVLAEVKRKKGPTLNPDEFPLPPLIIADARGVLQHVLGAFLQLYPCQNLTVLASGKTPVAYRNFLSQRGISIILAGEEDIDFALASQLLSETAQFNRILSLTGPCIAGHLVQQGLVSEISRMIHPVLAGTLSHWLAYYPGQEDSVSLHSKSQILRSGILWLRYSLVSK